MSGPTVGIIGGMGPAATIDLMAKIVAATPARLDQDHLRMLVDCDPAIPDRTEAILSGGPSPGPAMVRSAQTLERAGADFLVIACNTAHAFVDEVRASVGIPLLDMIEATVAEVERSFGRPTVGLLATTACIAASVYQTPLALRGIGTITLPPTEQEAAMQVIASIKSGEAGAQSADTMRRHAETLLTRGADVIVAGCTEVPLVLRWASDLPLISSTDALAAATLAYALPGQRGEGAL